MIVPILCTAVAVLLCALWRLAFQNSLLRRGDQKLESELRFYKDAHADLYQRSCADRETMRKQLEESRTREGTIVRELENVKQDQERTLIELAQTKYCAVRLEQTIQNWSARMTIIDSAPRSKAPNIFEEKYNKTLTELTSCQKDLHEARKQRDFYQSDIERYKCQLREIATKYREEIGKVELSRDEAVAQLSLCLDQSARENKHSDVQQAAHIISLRREVLSLRLSVDREKEYSRHLQNENSTVRLALDKQKERTIAVEQKSVVVIEKKPKLSDEAKIVQKVLTKKYRLLPNYEFKIQDEAIRRRKFDFQFIWEFMLFVLEYDGKQHFEDTGHYYYNPRADRDKTEVAMAHGFRVIRISYKELNNASYHVSRALTQKKKCYLSNPELYAKIGIVEVQ